MTSQIDSLLHARWIVPADEAQSLLEFHSIAVNQGKILEILPTDKAKLQYSAKNELELEDHLLMPGLINAHGHAAMSLFRGLADDLALMTWLQEHIWPAEGAFVSPEFVRDGTRLAIAEMLKSGTTCFSDMYFYPDVTAQCVQAAGMRAQLVFPIIDVATAWARDSDGCLAKGLALRDDYRDHDLITIGFGIHATYSVSEPTLRKIATLTNELDAPMQIHLHETRGEVQSALEATGLTWSCLKFGASS